jgi:hypothetical protein
MSLLTVAGCTRHAYVSKEMTWECAPEHDMPEYPGAQTVRFKFVEAPRFEEEVSGKGLCDQLRAAEKRTVVVKFDTWGNFYRGLIGYHQVFVDGKPIVDAGGWGSSGAKEGTGLHPLEKVYR